MGLSSCERRPVEEGEWLLALGLLERRLERVNLPPVLENDVFLFGKAERPS